MIGPICKEEKLKWNLDKNISVCKKKKKNRYVGYFLLGASISYHLKFE